MKAITEVMTAPQSMPVLNTSILSSPFERIIEIIVTNKNMVMCFIGDLERDDLKGSCSLYLRVVEVA